MRLSRVRPVIFRPCRTYNGFQISRRLVSTQLSSHDTRIPAGPQRIIPPTAASPAYPIRLADSSAPRDKGELNYDYYTPMSQCQIEKESPLQQYQSMVDQGTLRKDDHQTRIIGKLEHLYEQVLSYTPPPLPLASAAAPQGSFVRAVFLRLDALLTVSFSSSVSFLRLPTHHCYLHHQKTCHKGYTCMVMSVLARLCFHAFMSDVHKRVHAAHIALGLAGGDPIAPVARDLAMEAQVLCFDEFQVRILMCVQSICYVVE
jgi:hypothetical protein